MALLGRVEPHSYLRGTRYGVMAVHWLGLFPHGLISPEVTFLWQPSPPASAEARTLWLWVHPSAEVELESAIAAAIAATAPAGKLRWRQGLARAL